MKKIAIFGLVALLMIFPLTSCSKGNPPALEEVYDRLVEVIEEAHAVNTVLFGAGLPTYPRDGAEAALNNTYFSDRGDSSLEYVSPYAGYKSLGEIKDAMARVYGSAYAASLLESTFTGYAMTEDSNAVLPARYSEDASHIYQNRYIDPLVSGQRTYDYASMEIVDGDATHLTVAIRSYANNAPANWLDGDLQFIYENGNWYLDGPSC